MKSTTRYFLQETKSTFVALSLHIHRSHSILTMHQSEDGQKGQLKTLRILYWLAFVFFWAGFPLCIAHGVVSNQVLPALGLIPTFASMVTSVYRVYQLRKKDSEYQIIIGERQRKSTMSEHFTVYWALLDLAIINFDLLIYIFTCIVTFGKWGNRSDALGAYATMFLLFDM